MGVKCRLQVWVLSEVLLVLLLLHLKSIGLLLEKEIIQTTELTLVVVDILLG